MYLFQFQLIYIFFIEGFIRHEFVKNVSTSNQPSLAVISKTSEISNQVLLDFFDLPLSMKG